MRVAVVGAGTSGLFAALVLARDGHEVVVIERDARPTSSDPASWRRPGTPQALLPHAFMARGRALLRAHAPDVLQRLLDAGAVEFSLAPFVPGGARIATDDELVITFCRRPLLESALWQAAGDRSGVELRTETTVTRLAPGPTIATDRGELHADLVIDAAGRRTPLGKDTGAAAQVDECGIVYYSRFYRLRPGAELPHEAWLWGPNVELPFARSIVHLADRGVHSITFGVPPFDAELKVLRDARAFTAACAVLPAFAPWADPARVDPIGGVVAMGGLQNVLRPFVADGRVIPIGDALCHTNAIYGWGVTLGLEHASALAAVLRETVEPGAVALAYHARVWPEARARWELSAQQDRARVRLWRGEPPDDGARAAIMRVAVPAARLDAGVFRAVMRCSQLLDPADALLDPGLVASARAAIDRRGPVSPPPAPTRDQLLAALR